MKKAVLSLLVLLWVALACTHTAQAARLKYPRRYHRGSYAEYITIKRDGQSTVRQRFSGYSNGFPTPSFLYDGYPHSGYDYGAGSGF